MIEAFNEFERFTGIKTLSSTNTFQDSTINHIQLPTSITALAYGSVFQNCKQLLSIELHEGITQVGTSAFQGCTGLSVVEFPTTLNSLGNWWGMSASFISIFKIAAPPNTISASEVNRSAPSGKAIYVPDDAVETWKSAWSGLKSRIYPISEYIG